MRCHAVFFALGWSALCACQSRSRNEPAPSAADASHVPLAAPAGDRTSASVAPVPGGMVEHPLSNDVAYIPPQCYTKTRDRAGQRAKNPCYACHVRSEPPNYVDDTEFQVTWSFPAAAAKNHWSNLFAPPVQRAPHVPDADVLAYVRKSNYFDEQGGIPLARTLAALPRAWDGAGDGHWDGYIPDAWFSFDERGFDHRPDGSLTGWRAFAYYPFLGTFFPTNGSFDDVLVRLDPALRQDKNGREDMQIYALNLAIVEAVTSRKDVPIDAVDEAALGVDLDLDGSLGRATRVAFDAAMTTSPDGTGRMHYVGRAHEEELAGRLPMAAGLFPVGTEFLHTVRYLDVAPDDTVRMASRMKELRYGRKIRWFTYEELKAHAASEVVEQSESSDGALHVLWEIDRGIYNNQGWLFQGFIEAADGSLRPQSYDETAYCAGCHGEIGRTTDSIFSFTRKVAASNPAGGWYHWTQHDLRGLPEPRGRDGQYEYARYLERNGAGDELRENQEVQHRFFDEHGALRQREVERLHQDISQLLLPSAARARDLDRAYLAIVKEQSFGLGREAVLAPSTHVYVEVKVGEKTGIERAVDGATVAKISILSPSGKPFAAESSPKSARDRAKVPGQP